MTLNTHPLMPQRKKWTKDDDDMLMERFQSCTAKELADMIGCSRSTVYNHAHRLGLKKGSRYYRNKEARAFIEMEYANLTNKEIAKRCGISVSGVAYIMRELGLKRTREQHLAHLRKSLRKTAKQERARITFGVEQRTGWKLVSNKKKRNVRSNLGRAGYVVIKGDNVIYYTESLMRRPVLEEHAVALGLEIQPLPAASCAEETGELPASPAVLQQGNGTANYQTLQ